MNYEVCAFYRFAKLENLPFLQKIIKDYGRKYNGSGIILLAEEGINGTVAAPKDQLSPFIQHLDDILGIYKGELKYSQAFKNPFRRFKVRLKKEIITMKKKEADPCQKVGTYVAPEEWNEVISDPEVVLIDTRNAYETKVGMFDQAVDPKTKSFTEFADYVDHELDPAKHKKVAMYCTGGIRCEKASSYMLAKGFEEVYHLKGGILKYLECVPAEESKWQGECFVFDYRVAVGHGLEEGVHEICYGCRMPLGPEDLKAGLYEPGVSCPYCISSLTPGRAQMLRHRHRQLSSSPTDQGV